VKISARGRYAVRGMLDVALSSRNFPTPLADISLRQGITISNLEQLFSKLRRAGLVRSVRGPGGGYFLAQEPPQITIADILRAVEEPWRPKPRPPTANGNRVLVNGSTISSLTFVEPPHRPDPPDPRIGDAP
jgi:Rrf2 family protein